MNSVLYAAVILTALSINGLSQTCGVERWRVKTGTDADANLVNLNSTSSATIANLVSLPAPANKPENNRVQPTETTVFVLNATLTEYKLESDDSDYHLVLVDSTGKTFIAEIPLPACVGSGSPFAAAIANARSEFNARFTPTTSFKATNVPVQIKGVGFFDFLHGQTGVAPNGIELHPVLDISFNPTAVPAPALLISTFHTGSFVLGQSTAAYTILIQNNGSGATSGTVSVTDTLPAGLTATSITGPGWTCDLPSVTCSRPDALAGGGTYPPITVTVSVASSAVSPSTNQVSAAGGGSATATATDLTTILAAFNDVLTSDLFLPAIDLLREYAITTGCGASPPVYCPNNNITEGEMAVFVTRSVTGGDGFTYTPTAYFSDAPATHPFFPWIQKMQDLGIAVSCSSSQFCPGTPVTRGIMAVLIIRGRYGVSTPSNYPSAPYFTDVPPSHPYFPWIQKMKQLGITSGCSATTYCPDDPVTRGQMAVFIMRGGFNQVLPATTPVLMWASPASASPGQTAVVTMVGQATNFSHGATQVNAGAGITVSNIIVTNGTTLTAQFTVAPDATLGQRSITVTTGAEEATLPNGFRVQ